MARTHFKNNKGVKKMDTLVDMILCGSECLDAVVIVRIIVFMFCLELFATVAGLLGSVGRK